MASAGSATALRPLYPLRSRAQFVMATLGLAACYVLTGRLGLVFAMADGFVTAVWPPAGIALAGFLLFGFRVWPGLWFGSFIINFWGLFPQFNAAPTWLHVGPAIISATGAFFAAWGSAWLILKSGGSERSPLASVTGMFRLILIGGGLGCVISASVGCLTLCAIGHSPWAEFPLLWVTWWAGDAVGVLLFTPLILAWAGKDQLPMTARSGEALACIVALAAVAGFVFLSGPKSFFGGETHAFLCLPPMLWMALRLGSRGVTTGLVMLAAFAVWGTAHQHGPFGRLKDLNDSLLALNSFLAVSVFACLCIIAVAWMQRETARELREANRTLENRVAERTRNLQESQQRLELAIQAAQIGYWDFNPATNISHYSPDWKAQLGQPASDQPESSELWLNWLHPEDRPRTLTALTDYAEGRTPLFNQEFRLQHRDGTYRWIHSIGKLEQRPAGADPRMIGCHIDITSRKQIEFRWAALATLARQLNTTTDVSHAARMIVDLADSLIGWDAAVVVMYDAESGLSRSVLNIDFVNGARTYHLPNFSDQPPSPRLQRVLEHGAELVLREEPLVGSTAYYSFGDVARPSASLMFVPIRDGQQTVGMLSIQSYRLRAYTPADLEILQTLADHCGSALARIRSQELQREIESRLNEAQTLAQIGSFFWHSRTGQMIWSDELYRIYRQDQAAGQPTLELQLAAIHPDDQIRVREAWQALVDHGTDLNLDCRIGGGKGKIRWLHLRARRAHNLEQQPIGVEGTCQDITERKAFSEDLALFRRLVDQVNDAIEVIEPATGRFLDANANACAALGYTRTELLALTVLEIDAQINAQRYQEVLKELRRSTGLTLESQHRRKDGSVFPVEVSARLVSLDSDYIVTVVRDITDRKRTENILRESQERLELAASAAQIGFWDWDLQTNEVQFSPEWKAQIGYGPQELAGRFETWQELLHPDDRAVTLAKINAYLSGQAADYEVEFRLRHKDGSYRWIYTRGKMLSDESGKPRRVLGGHVNITERKYAEMHLRESREQLRLLVETANDAILFSSPNGHIIAANQAACRLLQYTEAELRQVGRQGITDPLDERVAYAVRQRNETGAFRGEMTFVRKDGSRFQGEIATALSGQKSEQQIATVVVRDITERTRLQAEQARALSLLQATIEATNEGLLVVDREGRVTVHNQRFAAMWQLPATLQSELDDAKLLAFVSAQLQVPEDFIARVRELYTHPEQESSDTLKFKDGRIFERYSRPQRLGAKIIGRVWSFRDVSEQHRAENAVRDSESRLHLALEVARMGSWDWDLQTNLILSDDRFAPLFGGPEVPPLTREADFQKFIHPEDRAMVSAALHQAIHATNHYQTVFRVVWTNDTTRWLESSGNVFRDETGRALRMVGVTVDITERRHAEESLRRSQQQYVELVNNIDGIVWEADARTARMTFVSSQAERILGYPLQDWTATDTFWQDHLHPQDRDAAINYCLERTQIGAPYEFEYRMIAADGRPVWIRDLVKVAMENGVPTKLRGILLDITTSKLADELANGQSRALEMIARGAPLTNTLTDLCHTLEAQLPGICCAILITDEEHNALKHGAAPSLPDDYNESVDGLAIGPSSGSCGTAAYRRKRVIVGDIASDPLWAAPFRRLAAQYGLAACWSSPILDSHRQVIGTVAIYHRQPGEPSTHGITIVDSITNTAAIAILKHLADEKLARSAEVLRQLSANLLDTQEAERRHLARELHDEIGQTLTATKLGLESLRQDFEKTSVTPSFHKPVNDAIGHVNRLLRQVRDLSLSLRPPMLDDFGLGPALRWLLDQHTRTTGQPVTFDAAHFTAKPDAALETACFRIAQEALTNISRHAQAQQVNVALHNDDHGFTLTVRDDGQGFDVSAARSLALAGGSLGLLGQQERAALVGGRVEIHSTSGTGTEVRVWFPLTLDEDPLSL